MLAQTISSAVDLTSDDHERQSAIRQILKSSAQPHPALNRVHLKLVTTAETETAICSYDRMHHRHARS